MHQFLKNILKLNNQTSIKSNFMRTYVYVFGCWWRTWRTYIYVLGCWHENILVLLRTVIGPIYICLVAEVQINWVREKRIKDVHIGCWLLEKIILVRKGLKLNVTFTPMFVFDICNFYISVFTFNFDVISLTFSVFIIKQGYMKITYQGEKSLF